MQDQEFKASVGSRASLRSAYRKLYLNNREDDQLPGKPLINRINSKPFIGGFECSLIRIGKYRSVARQLGNHKELEKNIQNSYRSFTAEGSKHGRIIYGKRGQRTIQGK